MASKSSDAERLLNTIVAARVRLSSLRGGSEFKGDVAAAPLDVSTHVRVLDEPREHEPEAPPQDLPVQRSNLEKAIPESPPIAPFEDQSFVLGIDPEETKDAPLFDAFDTEPKATITQTTPENNAPQTTIPDATALDATGAPQGSLRTDEEDPFSFIDLIPPDDTQTPTAVPTGETEPPSLAPPPVRPKPTMPLPIGLAAGAPLVHEPTDLHSEVPSSPIESTAQPRGDISPLSTHLSQPKTVAPRVLDPDRSILEVDVFENEVIDTQVEYPRASAPRLTESKPIQPPISWNQQTYRSEDDLFDTVTEASAHLNRGDVRAAHALFSDVLDWIPSHLEARLARGRCSRDMGDTVAAYSDFHRAQLHNPHSPGPQVELGDLFFAKKNYTRAISHYNEALSIDPQNALTLCRRGICHHYRKRADQAIDDLVMAQRLNPEIPNIERYIRMVKPIVRR